jgi:hypothetical protein
MTKTSEQPCNNELRKIPSVHELLAEVDSVPEIRGILASVKIQVIREIQDKIRKNLLEDQTVSTTKEPCQQS